jgi:7-hydroxymethyl chlorophyll a reductase
MMRARTSSSGLGTKSGPRPAAAAAAASSDSSGSDGGLAPDWRAKARPIQPGSSYPAKDLCSRCGLCDTYYVAHVKEACAFLGDGMAKIERMEPAVHGRAR